MHRWQLARPCGAEDKGFGEQLSTHARSPGQRTAVHTAQLQELLPATPSSKAYHFQTVSDPNHGACDVFVCLLLGDSFPPLEACLPACHLCWVSTCPRWEPTLSHCSAAQGHWSCSSAERHALESTVDFGKRLSRCQGHTLGLSPREAAWGREGADTGARLRVPPRTGHRQRGDMGRGPRVPAPPQILC